MAHIIRRALIALALTALFVPALLLASGALPYRVYVIHTGSMSPTIPSKSAVIVREGRYRLGQVITYWTPNGVVTHRLTNENVDGTLETKGDANRTVDPSSTQSANVIGGVVTAPRMAGYWLVYLKQPAGFASTFLAVICAWLLYTLPADFARQRHERKSLPGRRVAASAVGPRSAQAVRRTTSAVDKPLAPEGAPAALRCRRSGEPARKGDHVILVCSRCDATFHTGDGLRGHVSGAARPGSTSLVSRPASRALPTGFAPHSLGRRAT